MFETKERGEEGVIFKLPNVDPDRLQAQIARYPRVRNRMNPKV